MKKNMNKNVYPNKKETLKFRRYPIGKSNIIAFGDVLRKIIADNKITMGSFSKNISYTLGHVSNICAGRDWVGEGFVDSVIKHYPSYEHQLVRTFDELRTIQDMVRCDFKIIKKECISFWKEIQNLYNIHNPISFGNTYHYDFHTIVINDSCQYEVIISKRGICDLISINLGKSDEIMNYMYDFLSFTGTEIVTKYEISDNILESHDIEKMETLSGISIQDLNRKYLNLI